MGKLFLISVVLVPTLLGILTARNRTERGGLVQLLALWVGYTLFYMIILYYLRRRWV